jgi:glutathione S-transferase
VTTFQLHANLATALREAGLLPDNVEDEARVVSWMSFAASTLHHARSRGIEHANAAYRIADRRLAGQEWALERYSIADIHLFRLFWRFNASLRPTPAHFPNLSAHHDRMLAREAVRRTIGEESAIGYELPP